MASTEQQVENTQTTPVESVPAPQVMDEINTARLEQQNTGAGLPNGGNDRAGQNSGLDEQGNLDFGKDNIYQSHFNQSMEASSSSESAAPEFENDPVLDYAEKNFEKLDGDGDGRITSRELQDHSRRNGENMTPEERANLAHLRGRHDELQNTSKDDGEGPEKGISLEDLNRAQIENVQRQQQEQRGSGGGTPGGGNNPSPFQIPGPNDLNPPQEQQRGQQI
jgi:hypothetical protein